MIYEYVCPECGHEQHYESRYGPNPQPEYHECRQCGYKIAFASWWRVFEGESYSASRYCYQKHIERRSACQR